MRMKDSYSSWNHEEFGDSRNPWAIRNEIEHRVKMFHSTRMPAQQAQCIWRGSRFAYRRNQRRALFQVPAFLTPPLIFLGLGIGMWTCEWNFHIFYEAQSFKWFWLNIQVVLKVRYSQVHVLFMNTRFVLLLTLSYVDCNKRCDEYHCHHTFTVFKRPSCWDEVGKCLMMVTFQNKIIYMVSTLKSQYLFSVSHTVELAWIAPEFSSRNYRQLWKRMSGYKMEGREDKVYRWY